jgi:hypothetical protein
MGCFAVLGYMLGATIIVFVPALLLGGLFGTGGYYLSVLVGLALLILLPRLPARAFKRWAGGEGKIARFDQGVGFKGIAISKDGATIYLSSPFTRKEYGIQEIRNWTVWKKAPFLGSTQYAVRLEVRDVDHPVWEISWPRERKANQWAEILTQAIESAKRLEPSPDSSQEQILLTE